MAEERKDTIGSAGATGPLGPNQRWTVVRKREVALRVLRGESMDALGRELGIEIYRLEAWKSKALAGIDASLREREGGSAGKRTAIGPRQDRRIDDGH